MGDEQKANIYIGHIECSSGAARRQQQTDVAYDSVLKLLTKWMRINFEFEGNNRRMPYLFGI